MPAPLSDLGEFPRSKCSHVDSTNISSVSGAIGNHHRENVEPDVTVANPHNLQVTKMTPDQTSPLQNPSSSNPNQAHIKPFDNDIFFFNALRTQTDTRQSNFFDSVPFAFKKSDTDMEEGPVTDTEQSTPNTGMTLASEQTEATSPALSASGDELTLSWKQKLSPLVSNFVPRIQEIKDTDDESTIIFKPGPLGHEVATKESSQLNSRWAIGSSHLMGSAPGFRSGVSTSTLKENLLGEIGDPAPPARTSSTEEEKVPVAIENHVLSRAAPQSAYNPLAQEWRPSVQQANLDCSQELRDPLTRSKLTVAAPKLTTYSALPLEDNDRVLDWAGSVPQVPSLDVITPGLFSNTLVESRRDLGTAGVHAPRRVTITAPLPVTRPYQQLTLAQRRAEAHVADPEARLSQLAPHTAPLQVASLYMAQGDLSPANSTATNVTPSQIQYSFHSAPSTATPTHATTHQARSHPASHTQSLTWKRPANLGLDHASLKPVNVEWLRVEANLLRMGLIKRIPGQPDGGSFAVPKSFDEYLDFLVGRKEDLLDVQQARIYRSNTVAAERERICKVHATDNVHGYLRSSPLWRKHAEKKPARGVLPSSPLCRQHVKIEPAMKGNDYIDGRGTVLACPTTWRPRSWQTASEERPQAPWPCVEEMKEEGDERHTSQFRRFPALPRVPGNPTVVWKVKHVVPMLPFDEVWRLPTAEDWNLLYGMRGLPKSLEEEAERRSEDAYMNELIGPSLLRAIS